MSLKLYPMLTKEEEPEMEVTERSKTLYSSIDPLEKYLREIKSDISYGVERKVLLKKLDYTFVQLLRANGAFIAGGAITSIFCDRSINDIDIFFRSEEGYNNVMDKILSSGSYNGMHRSDNATTFGNLYGCQHPIQLINLKFYPTILDIFNDFDFSVCCGLYDCVGDEFHFSGDFFKHNSQRKLSYNTNNDYPLMTMMRSEKYKRLGYSFPNAELLKVLFKINSLNIKTNKDALKQMTGFYIDKKVNFYMNDVLNNEEPFDINTVSEILGSFTYSPIPESKSKDRFNLHSYADYEDGATSPTPVDCEPPEEELPF